MKPLGGIVTNKKSIGNSFEKVDQFTTEDLNKLWKVYSVNRDVIEKGHRLENLFWRIWGSERSGRPFSGRVVAAIFMAIHQSSDDLVDRRKSSSKPLTATTPRTAQTSQVSQETTPRHSLEVEVPPTPPPSPIPTNSATSSYVGKLAQLPAHNEITEGLQQLTFPPPPPSPPVPTGGIESMSSPVVLVPGPSRPSSKSGGIPSIGEKPSSIISDARTSPTLVSESGSYVSTSSISSSSTGSSESIRRVKGGRGGRQQARGNGAGGGGRGRKPTTSTKVSRTRGLRPPLTRKASSSSNTAVNTTVNSPTDLPEPSTAEMALSYPAARKLPSRRQSSMVSEPEASTSGKGNFVVDRDFRSKYLEQKRKEGLAALASITPPVKTGPTAAVTESVVTARSQSKGKRKGSVRMLVVDSVAPLKGVVEEDEEESLPSNNGGNGGRRKLDPMGVRDGLLPSDLQRRGSGLTILFENNSSGTDGTSSISSKHKGNIRR